MDIVIHTLSEYVQCVEDVVYLARDNNLIPHRWFRGHADISWSLIPGIQRKFTHNDDFFENERCCNTDFQSRACVFLKDKPALDDFSGWLTRMQHYGFPTRLLDWSRSPLYALYFAVFNEKHYDKDGCIYVLNPSMLNDYAKLEDNMYLYHMQHKTAKEVVYTAFRRNTCKNDKYEKYNNTILACYPTESDARVFNQQSVFTIHSTLTTLDDINSYLELVEKRGLLVKILIPSKSKAIIFKQLYLCGITHGNVFPDLEHVANDIQRSYGID